MDPYATNSFKKALCNLHTASLLVWSDSIKPQKYQIKLSFPNNYSILWIPMQHTASGQLCATCTQLQYWYRGIL